MYCPHCGKPIEEKTAFCPSCGKPTGKTLEKSSTKVAKGISLFIVLLCFYATFADSLSDVDNAKVGLAAYIILFLLIGCAYILYKTKVTLFNIVCYGGLTILYCFKILELSRISKQFSKYLDFGAFKFLYWMYLILLIISTIILVMQYRRNSKDRGISSHRFQLKQKLRLTKEYLNTSASPEQINTMFDRNLIYMCVFVTGINLLGMALLFLYNFVLYTIGNSYLRYLIVRIAGPEFELNLKLSGNPSVTLLSLIPMASLSLFLFILIYILKVKGNDNIVTMVNSKLHHSFIFVSIASILRYIAIPILCIFGITSQNIYKLIAASNQYEHIYSGTVLKIFTDYIPRNSGILGFLLSHTISSFILSSLFLFITYFIPAAVLYLIATKRITPFGTRQYLIPLSTSCIIILIMRVVMNLYVLLSKNRFDMISNIGMLIDIVVAIFFGLIVNKLLSFNKQSLLTYNNEYDCTL